MPYPGLFVRVFFSLMASAAVVRFVLLGFFGFNFLPVWSLCGIIEITDWRFQAKPSTLWHLIYLVSEKLSGAVLSQLQSLMKSSGRWWAKF